MHWHSVVVSRRRTPTTAARCSRSKPKLYCLPAPSAANCSLSVCRGNIQGERVCQSCDRKHRTYTAVRSLPTPDAASGIGSSIAAAFTNLLTMQLCLLLRPLYCIPAVTLHVWSGSRKVAAKKGGRDEPARRAAFWRTSVGEAFVGAHSRVGAGTVVARLVANRNAPGALPPSSVRFPFQFS